VAASNVAQAGLFTTVNVSRSPSASDAVGLKEYGWRMTPVVTGLPPITGGRLATVVAVMEKLASVAVKAPSDTLIEMLDEVPATVGVPLSRPVVELNVAHAGLFVILKVNALPSGSDAVGVKL